MDEPVRPASPGDISAVMAIYAHAVRHSVASFDLDPPGEDSWPAWFERFDDDDPLLVHDSGSVQGFAYYLPYRSRSAYAGTRESSVYVAPEFHGRGIGTALYEGLIEHARRRGVHTLLAVIAGDHPASVALHRRHGFVEVGHLREVGRKFDRWVDTRIFQLML